MYFGVKFLIMLLFLFFVIHMFLPSETINNHFSICDRGRLVITFLTPG